MAMMSMTGRAVRQGTSADTQRSLLLGQEPQKRRQPRVFGQSSQGLTAYRPDWDFYCLTVISCWWDGGLTAWSPDVPIVCPEGRSASNLLPNRSIIKLRGLINAGDTHTHIHIRIYAHGRTHSHNMFWEWRTASKTIARTFLVSERMCGGIRKIRSTY